MKRSLMILSIAAMSLLFTGCTAMLSMSMSGIGDLYRTDNRAEVAARLKAEAELERLAAEARQAQWEARLAEANASAAEAEYYAVVNNEPSYMSVVADDYESAYARRLYGFQSPTYNMPSSYYNMVNNSSIYYVTAYDPSYYNIMVSGDQVWVEPKYITSMFGSWGATNVTFGIYASPWNYGWSYHANPFYYSMWGYPRYSWYDWNWAMCYNPFYYDWCWGGYYDPFYPHYHHHHHHHHHYHPGYYPMPPRPGSGHGHGPENRPGYGPTAGSGASAGPGNLNGNRNNTGSRYTSPTTKRNYGADSRGDGRNTNGSTSLGFNSNSVKTTTGVSNSRLNAIESNTRINTGVTNSSGSSSGSNFRTGSSTTSGTRINTTTTTTTTQNRTGSTGNKVDASRTNNYRQGSSSSSSSSRVSSSSSSSRSSSSSSSSYRSSSSSSSSSFRSGSSSSSSFRSGGTSSSSGSSRSSGSSSGSRR